jgi:hypothetical protein
MFSPVVLEEEGILVAQQVLGGKAIQVVAVGVER